MFEECRLEGDFTLSSGRHSGVFYDLDLLQPRETANYVEKLLHEIPEEMWAEIDFVASPALGGVIPGFLVAFARQKPFVFMDKGGQLRGPEFKSGKYLIVDDVITSFQAANKIVAACGPGCVVVAAAAFIFRGNRQDLEKQDYPAFYLTRKEQEEQ